MSFNKQTPQNYHSFSKHNHEVCISDALDKAKQLCRQRGVQMTSIRQKVLELILASHRAVKAYDLLDSLKASTHTAKPATVYRALDFLIEQGLIHRIESLNAFIGCHHSDRKHEQLLLICSICLEVEERPANGVMSALSVEMDAADFRVDHKYLEIHGACLRCQQEATKT